MSVTDFRGKSQFKPAPLFNGEWEKLKRPSTRSISGRLSPLLMKPLLLQVPFSGVSAEKRCVSGCLRTHSGSVTAATDWDGPAELKKVVPSRPDSFEYLFHDSGLENFLLPIRGRDKVQAALAERRLERAMGVIYRPDTERVCHYFHTDLVRQFDAVIHQTSAVKPLKYSPAIWKAEEVPETYPFGL